MPLHTLTPDKTRHTNTTHAKNKFESISAILTSNDCKGLGFLNPYDAGVGDQRSEVGGRKTISLLNTCAFTTKDKADTQCMSLTGMFFL